MQEEIAKKNKTITFLKNQAKDLKKLVNEKPMSDSEYKAEYDLLLKSEEELLLERIEHIQEIKELKEEIFELLKLLTESIEVQNDNR